MTKVLDRMALQRAVIDKAKAGDYRELLSWLRTGRASRELCDFAADIIAGKVKRPKHRPARHRTAREMLQQARRVRELERSPGGISGAQQWHKQRTNSSVGKTAIQESLSVMGPLLDETEEAIRIFEIIQEYRQSESNGLDDDMPLADIVKAAMSWHASRKLRT